MTFHRFESAIDSMRKLGDDEHLLEAYFILGHLYDSLHNLTQAVHYFNESLQISRKIYSSHTTTATLLYFLGQQLSRLQASTYNEKSNSFERERRLHVCSYFEESFSMHKSLHFYDVRTYQAALQAGLCPLGDHMSLVEDHFEMSIGEEEMRITGRAKGIHFLQIAFQLQQELPERSNCTMCAVQILALLGGAHFPSMYSPHDDKSNISIASDCFNQTLEYFKHMGALPSINTDNLNINCAATPLPLFTINISFETKYYCAMAQVQYFHGLALLGQHKYQESRDMLQSSYNLQVQVNQPSLPLDYVTKAGRGCDTLYYIAKAYYLQQNYAQALVNLHFIFQKITNMLSDDIYGCRISYIYFFASKFYMALERFSEAQRYHDLSHKLFTSEMCCQRKPLQLGDDGILWYENYKCFVYLTTIIITINVKQIYSDLK